MKLVIKKIYLKQKQIHELIQQLINASNALIVLKIVFVAIQIQNAPFAQIKNIYIIKIVFLEMNALNVFNNFLKKRLILVIVDAEYSEKD